MRDEQEYMRTSMLASLAGIPTSEIREDIKRGVLIAEQRDSIWFIHTENIQRYVDYRKSVSQSISAREVEKRTKLNKNKILEAIQKGELIAFKRSNGTTSRWCILEKDVQVFIDRINHSETKPITETKPTQGTPDECGNCHTTKGNILADINPSTMHRDGYLCTSCLKLRCAIRGYTNRAIHTMLDYIETTEHNTI